MLLAIVGSTILHGNPLATLAVDLCFELFHPDNIVSGGARGVDTIAANVAIITHGLTPIIHRPTVRRWWGPGGFKERNIRIATDCDALVRIWSPLSKTYGSGWTRDYAARLGKPTVDICIH